MPVFKYQAREPMGNIVRSTIAAVDMRAAMRELLSRGNTIAWIKPQNSAFLDSLGPLIKPLVTFMGVAAVAFVAVLMWRAQHH
jgi:type II secretory pathway component PulF